ncbi:MAG: type II secretion system F family protein [archaeon]
MKKLIALSLGSLAVFYGLSITENYFIAIASGIIVSALVIAWFHFKPLKKKKKLKGLIEKELPFILISLNMQLHLGVSFLKALENSTKESTGIISKELNKVLNEIREQGSSVQEALLHASERNDSTLFKRTITQLIVIYEQGNQENINSLKVLSKEILARQKIIAKEFSGKLLILSLLFIAVSAIVPALFQALVIVGSSFLSLTITPIQVIVFSVILIPLLDIGILYYIKLKTPEFLKGD